MVSSMIKFGSNGFISRNNEGLSVTELRNSGRFNCLFADKAHESRSSRYSFISTEEIMTAMVDNGFILTEVRVSGTRVPGQSSFGKHIIRFRQTGLSALSVGDTLFELMLTNSHNGGCGYGLSSGWFKLACANGLCVSLSEHSAIGVRHSGSVDDVIDASFTVISDASRQAPLIEDMRSIKLDKNELTIFAESAMALKSEDLDEVKNGAQAILRPRRTVDVEPTLWNTFNVVQENLVKGGRRAQGGRKMRAVNGIDENTKLNRSLWALAERMAELKR